MVGVSQMLLVAGIFVLIPLGGMVVGVVMQWLKTKERMLAIEKGVVLPPDPVHVRDPWERAAGFRVAGLVLTAVGLGLLVLFLSLSATVYEFPKAVTAVAAIPFLIGLVMFYEYRIRSRELGPRPSPPASTPQPRGAGE